MQKIKLILNKIEKQRQLLEEKIKHSENLSNPKIIMESQKLDSILNEYIKEINKD